MCYNKDMKNRLKKNIKIVLLILFLMSPITVLAEDDNIDNKELIDEQKVVTDQENNNDQENINDQEVEEKNSILDEGQTSNINIKVSWKLKDNGNIFLSWNKIDDTSHYKVHRTDKDGNLIEISFSKKENYEFKNLDTNKSYKFLVEAYTIKDDNYVLIDKSPITEAIKPIKFVPYTSYKKVYNKTVKEPKRLNINLREMLNESSKGYSTVQGSCTDNNYIYYLMISKSTDKGRILKINKNNLLPDSRSKVLNIVHGNGIACNSKEKKLIGIALNKIDD